MRGGGVGIKYLHGKYTKKVDVVKRKYSSKNWDVLRCDVICGCYLNLEIMTSNVS